MSEAITNNLDLWSSALRTKATAGRGSNGQQEAYGIKKLRELILELAVQGKLLPQEGKWSQTWLGDLGEWAVGSGFPKTEQGKEGLEILFAKVSDMNLPENAKLIVKTNHTISEEKAKRLGINIHSSGTVIFPKIGGAIATNKRRILTRPTAIDNNCLGITPKKNVSIDWLYLVLSSIDFSKYQAGTSVPALSQGTLAKISVELPAPPEQLRIVAKVDELMALCAQLEKHQTDSIESHQTLVQTLLGTLTRTASPQELSEAWTRIANHFDTLFTTEHSIDQLKQTILQLAVTGKLLPQDPNAEPADALLDKIAAEKRRLTKEGSLRKEKQLPPLTNEEMLFQLPEGWAWVKFGTIAEFINGDRSKNYPNRNEYVADGIPWINTGHIEPDGHLTTQDMNFITREKFDSLNGGKIQSGDLVYCLRGATFGKTAFVEPYEEGAIASSLMIIRPFFKDLNKYIFHYLNSPFGKKQLLRFDNGSAQPNLSAGSVLLYAFPLPPLEEQHRIVGKVDELMALCDALTRGLAEGQTTQIHLANAIVEQAVA